MAKADINEIPYDAPYAFSEPSRIWINWKNHQGANSTFVDDSSYPEVPVSGKWVIVSGSNNGIGREAALKFAAWGANLILACRNPPASEIHPTVVVEECQHEALLSGYKTTVEWWELDMGSLASVEAFAARWLATGRPLDILCNNAGVGSSPGGGEVFRTKDGFEFIHQINFLSHALLTLRLLPSIAKAAEPRIVCTTSCFHYHGTADLTDFNGELNKGGQEGVKYYMNNKLFFQTWLTELQARLLQHDAYKHITVQGVHPGYVNSGIWNLNNAKGAWLKEGILKIMASFLGVNTQQGSLCITHAATAVECGPNPAVQGVGKRGGLGGGLYWNRVWQNEPMPHTMDPDYRNRVWRKTNDELKLQEKGLLDVLGVYAKA